MTEPLGLLLLPAKLEAFGLEAHARRLLEIPRVIALEPPPFRVPRLLRDSAPVRQAKRLRLPGEPRLIVLYHPAQYRLARALLARFGEAELWYVRPEPGASGPDGAGRDPDLAELDRLARERATEPHVLPANGDGEANEQPIRLRLRELGVISHRPFIPQIPRRGLTRAGR